MTQKRRRLPRFGGELERPLRLVARRPAWGRVAEVLGSPEFRNLVNYHTVGAGKTSAVVAVTRRALAEAAERERLIAKKLELLMAHFGIAPKDKGAWRSLSIRLAESFVRGFQDGTRPGAPERWGPSELAALREQIDALVAEGHPVISACRVLCSAQKTEQRFPHCNSVGTMKRRYYQAKQQN